MSIRKLRVPPGFSRLESLQHRTQGPELCKLPLRSLRQRLVGGSLEGDEFTGQGRAQGPGHRDVSRGDSQTRVRGIRPEELDAREQLGPLFWEASENLFNQNGQLDLVRLVLGLHRSLLPRPPLRAEFPGRAHQGRHLQEDE